MPRIKELDFVKGVLILLVIAFHLVWFEQLHPDLKQVVYSFHMPGFLFVSGFLMNVGKAPRPFLRTLLWLAVPYLFMASGYITMASILPINDHIDHLTLPVFLDRLLLHPLGPPWFLHALILCEGLYYIMYRAFPVRSLSSRGEGTDQGGGVLHPGRGGAWGKVLLTGIAYYVCAHILGILSFSSALYFLAGAALRQSGTDFVGFFRPSPLSIAAFALIASFAENPNQASLSGVLIAYSAISSLLWLYTVTPPKGGRGFCLLGRNSLPLYVFSPVFTVLCKRLVPYLRFDSTGLVFLFLSLAVCVAGSLAIARAMDLAGISRYFFGRKAIAGG